MMGSIGRIQPLKAGIRELEESYCFPTGEDRARIVSILRSSPNAVAILKEAPSLLRSIFGRDAELRLELDRDPEGGFEEIFATVRSDHSPEEGLQLLQDFDLKWWLSRCRDVGGKLNFTWDPTG